MKVVIQNNFIDLSFVSQIGKLEVLFKPTHLSSSLAEGGTKGLMVYSKFYIDVINNKEQINIKSKNLHIKVNYDFCYDPFFRVYENGCDFFQEITENYINTDEFKQIKKSYGDLVSLWSNNQNDYPKFNF